MFNFEVLTRSIKAHFDQEMNFLSWAIIGGGFTQGSDIYIAGVENKELPIHLDPIEVLKNRMRLDGLNHAVAMMTSAKLKNVTYVKKEKNDLTVEILTTVGMGNSLRVGDEAINYLRVGTINIICVINKPLSINAQLEAVSIACEARTLAVIEEEILSKKSNQLATGTGTDCLVMASPKNNNLNQELIYAGKHTVLGELIGSATLEAVKNGILKWKEEQNAQNHTYSWGS